MSETIGHHLEEYREMRRQVEASLLELATSVDGRRFEFQARIASPGLAPGGYVMLEHPTGQRLGQVLSMTLERTDAAEVGWDLEGGGIRSRLEIRFARGAGTILSGDQAPFHDATMRAATPEEVAAWLEQRGNGRARLAAGELRFAPGVPFALEAAGFDRHTFFCGQSGSGKTYSLGVVLEQLLLETSLQMVILDPNSDMARLGSVRAGVDDETAARWRTLAAGIDVRSGTEGPRRLHLKLAELDQDAQASALRLDPVADRAEYAELGALLEEARPESLDELVANPREGAHEL